MKKNMGNLDRFIRIVLALMIGIFYISGDIGGTAAIVLIIIAVILLLTSIISFCPIYIPFKISTIRKSKDEQGK